MPGQEDGDFDTTLSALLDDLESATFKASNEAVTVVAMLLEMNARPVSMPSPPTFYEDMVPQALRARPLREDEEREIVRRLERAFTRTRRNASNRAGRSGSLLWAIGKSSPWVGVRPLIDALHEPDLSESEMYQALSALWGMLGLPPGHPRLDDLRGEIEARDPRVQLSRIADASWIDERIVRDARVALQLTDECLTT